jgi:hypothetical protein
VPDTAGTATAFAVADARPVTESAEPAFRSLFHNNGRPGDGRGAVSPIVSELWSSPAQSPPPPKTNSVSTVTAQAVAAPAAPEPLDLFRDMRPDVRSLFRGNGRA